MTVPFSSPAVATRRPSPDIKQLRAAVGQAVKQATLGTLAADAGYDAEWSYVWLREQLGIESIIPPKIGRPTSKPPTGRWRRYMAEHFDKERYGQRWQIETVMSMIKRRLGSALTARKYQSQCQEIRLRALTHNPMILRPAGQGFLRSMTVPFSPPETLFIASAPFAFSSISAL